MKRLTLRLLAAVIFVFLLAIPANAQKKVRKFEAGMNLGISLPIQTNLHGKEKADCAFGLAARYNLPYTQWSFGLELQWNCMRREFLLRDAPIKLRNTDQSFDILLVTDYNFNQGEKVNPFVSVGFGIADNQAGPEVHNVQSSTNFCFSPRIGMELLSNIRLSAGFIFSRSAFNGFFATAGFVIGGRPIKNKNIENE